MGAAACQLEGGLARRLAGGKGCGGWAKLSLFGAARFSVGRKCLKHVCRSAKDLGTGRRPVGLLVTATLSTVPAVLHPTRFQDVSSGICRRVR